MNCDKCNKTFKNIYYVETHRLEFHKEDATKCKFCGYTGVTKNIIPHIKDIHLDLVNCEICNKEIKSSYMNEHLKNVHITNENYEYACEECALLFKTEKTLKRHYKTASHKSRIQANDTNIKIEDINDKLMNIKINDGKIVINKENKHKKNRTYECHYENCEKIYSSSTGLKRHIDNIHKNITYGCDKCDRKFGRNDQLLRHKREVHDEKPMKTCELCKKEMTERKYYESHLKNCLIKQAYGQYPGISKWEKFIHKYLIENEIQRISEKTFDDLRQKGNLRYDFYLPEFEAIIEVHGKQHYIPSNYKNGKEKFKETQLHDRLKEEYAKEKGIKYIVIDTRKYKTPELISEFLDKNLK